MSRRLWRCRNPDCAERGGALLGRLTADDGLVLDPTVREFRCYLDTAKVILTCPACGTTREFRGTAVIAW